MQRLFLLALVCFALAACASNTPHGTLPVAQDVSAEHAQLLIMLRAPPQHFQPASVYGGSYRSSTDEAARRRIARQLAREHNLILIDDWPMPSLGLDCFVMRAAEGVSTTALADLLAKDSRVESAQAMQLFHVLGRPEADQSDVRQADKKGDPLYTLQPAASRWHLSQLHEIATGKGVTIAEIDSGVDSAHPDLQGQVVQTQNFIDDNPYHPEKHGTEVAGIMVAHEGNGLGIAGIAPDAHLLALRACWEDPARNASAVCSSFTLAKALQFVMESRASVLNMSLAGPNDRLLERLLDAAMARHITVVSAVDENMPDGGFPASYPGVLAVAGDQAGHGPSGTLYAPSRDIPATVPGGAWDFVTGSSFAAAQVSGLVALMRELSPEITVAHLHDAMKPETTLGLTIQRPAMIDACAAVARASGHCACDCTAASVTSSVPR
jgi:predicted small secreted protein